MDEILEYLTRVEGVPAIATMFVVTDNGNEVRPIVDGSDENKVIKLPMTEMDALGRAPAVSGEMVRKAWPLRWS